MESEFNPDELIDPAKQALIDAIFRLNQLANTGLEGWAALERVQGPLSVQQARQVDILHQMQAIVQELAEYAASLGHAEALMGMPLLRSYVDGQRLTVARGCLQDDALSMTELFMTTWDVAPR